MARDAFQDIAPLLDAACGSALDTPLGHLLGDYMIALEHRLAALTEADLARLEPAKELAKVASRQRVEPSRPHR